MKYAPLHYWKTNYGDEIQIIAASKFFPRVDFYLDRDHLSNYDGDEKIKTIFNGWFMYGQYGEFKDFDWPPPENIKPLVISHYVANKEMLSAKGLEFYKKHEPIGCRDIYTTELLRNNGIDAYFSGCITLTLENDKANKKREGIYFVDPFGPYEGSSFAMPGEENFRNDLWEKLPQSLRDSAEYLTHYAPNRKKVYPEDKRAEELLEIYKTAELVITNRMHVALPCIAFGTPVVCFYERNKRSNNRLTGYTSFFESYSFDEILEGKFDLDKDYSVKNVGKIKEVALHISNKCQEFFK